MRSRAEVIFSGLDYIPLEYPSYDFSLCTRDEAAWQRILTTLLYFSSMALVVVVSVPMRMISLSFSITIGCFPFGLTLLFLFFSSSSYHLDKPNITLDTRRKVEDNKIPQVYPIRRRMEHLS